MEVKTGGIHTRWNRILEDALALFSNNYKLVRWTIVFLSCSCSFGIFSNSPFLLLSFPFGSFPHSFSVNLRFRWVLYTIAALTTYETDRELILRAPSNFFRYFFMFVWRICISICILFEQFYFIRLSIKGDFNFNF